MTGPWLARSSRMRAPKTPVSTGTPRARSDAQKLLVEPLGDLGLGCFGEARTVALLRVGDQRELADDERCTAHVDEVVVELPVHVLEDAKAGDTAGESLGVFGLVPARNAEQDAQAKPDLSHDLLGDHNPRLGDALDDRSHGC